MSRNVLKSIYDIREDEIKIEGKAWDDEQVQQLAHKKILQFDKMIDWNAEWLERSQKYMDYYRGKILSDYQRSVYEDVEDKIVFEPPIAKSPIRALVGQTIKSRKSGQITTEGGGYGAPAASTEEITTINMALKDMEIKTGEKYKVRDAIHDAFVSCYPNVLYYEKAGPGDPPEVKFKLRKLPTNSVVFGSPNFNESDCSDLTEIAFFDLRSQAQLEENFPKMVEQIREHFDMGDRVDSHLLSSLAQWEDSEGSETRDRLWNVIERAYGSIRSSNGLCPVVMHLYPIRKKIDVWMNIFDDSERDFEVRPPEWSDERWQKWIDENKDRYAGPYQKEVRVLWVTVFTLSGLVLSNEMHWFQENGRLPVSWWVPAMIGGMPTGPMEDMADDVLRNCVAQIEWLDDVRKGHGTLALFRQGALTKDSMENIAEEANKAFGVAVIDANFQGSVQDAFAEIKRDPTNIWEQYAASARSDMYENTRLNETMQGAAAPRQAAVAKELEIAQALIVNALYIDNMNRAWENHQNLKLMLIPYGYNEYDILDIYDEEQQAQVVQPVNVPVYDAEGNKVEVINDLTSRKYRWRMNPVDDSPTAKVRQAEEALMIINGAAGPLLDKDPTGKMFANFLVSFPNELLNKAGKAMAQDAQLAMEAQNDEQKQDNLRKANIELEKVKNDRLKAAKSGINLSFTGEQIAQYPKLLDLIMQMQQIASMQAEQGMQPKPEQQPAPMQ